MKRLCSNLASGANQPRQGVAYGHAPGAVIRGMRLLAAVLLRGWLRLYGRLTVIGRHNLPTGSSFVLIANHASHLDTLFLLSALPLRQLHRTFAVAAQDYFCVNPLITFFARLFINIIPLDRGRPGRHSLDVCAELLQQPGTVVILFPEGTRGCGHEPGVFKPGIGLLAAGQSIPVVPCHVAGTDASLPKGAWIPRPKAVRLTFGKGRLFGHLPENRRSRTQICHELRDAVMVLGRLPSAA